MSIATEIAYQVSRGKQLFPAMQIALHAMCASAWHGPAGLASLWTPPACPTGWSQQGPRKHLRAIAKQTLHANNHPKMLIGILTAMFTAMSQKA